MLPEKAISGSTVILFDGVCNLCSGAVQFVLKRDKQQVFRFAALQSGFGQQVLRQYHLPTTDFNSFVLIEEGRLYTRSTAALRIVRRLSGWWPALSVFLLLPSFIRDAVYNWVARNRYKWFGKQETCWLPTRHSKPAFWIDLSHFPADDPAEPAFVVPVSAMGNDDGDNG